MNKFYVYFHYKAGTKEVFYIGKGTGNRCYQKTSRNPLWKNITAKYGRDVKLIAQGLSESMAFRLEMRLIKLYQSRGVRLANLTQGGDGPSGRKHSKETLARMSEMRKGKYTPSLARNIGISRGRKGKPICRSRKVQCIATGEIFESITSAAAAIGSAPTHMSGHLHYPKRNKTVKGLVFRFI